MKFSTPSACESLIDHVIDNYRLLEIVGQGGMGCVYRARDEKMGRIVALKLLHNNLGAFTLREGKALGQLNHPNIVNVFYMGESREGVFIIMEFVDGTTLHDCMNRPVADIIPVMKQSLLALEHAHEAGVIHRDIKPSNIMVSKIGQVKVMDFGLAKVESPDKDRTVTRLQAGTISYMSPEQVRGLQHVSQLSDIYSLGKTFYHILARRLPFDASESDQYSILKAIIERQFKPPGHYNRDVPRGLDKIIMKAIEKEPSQRFQSAREMYNALVAFETRTYPMRGHAKPPPLPSTPLFSRFSLSRKQWTFGVALLFTLLCITAFASWYTNRDTQTSLAEQTHTTIPIEGEGSSGSLEETPSSDPSQQTSTPVSQASITIASTPVNSSITLGDTRLRAPVNRHVTETGQYTLMVESDGYDAYSNTITLKNDTTIFIELVPQGRLIVESSVPGAQVEINGESIGRTPINRQIEKGSYMVVVSADGYSTYSSQVNVQSGNATRVDAPLQLQGELLLQTTPGADIYINNRKQRWATQSGSFERTLSPGRYVVRVSHVDYGTWEKSIRVRSGEQNISVDFTKQIQVNIGANIFGASIYIDGVQVLQEIDGVQVPQEAPARLNLGVGMRRIEVRKEGYSSEPAFVDLLVEGTEEGPLQFAFVLSSDG